MSNYKEHFLRCMVMMTVLALFYPLSGVLRMSLFKIQFHLTDIILYGSIIMAGYITSAAGMRGSRLRRYKKIAAISGLIPIAAGIIFYSESVQRLLFEIPLLLLFYYWGFRGLYLRYTDIIDPKTLVLGVIASGVCYFVIEGNVEYSSFRMVFFLCAYYSLMMVVILMNQSSLEDFLKNSREYANAPRDIRKLNVQLTVILIILILILLNLKGLIILLLSFLQDMVYFLLSLINKLASWVTSGDGLKEMEGKKAFMDVIRKRTVRPYANLALNTALKAVLLYTAYKFILLLYSMLKDIYRQIKSRFFQCDEMISGNEDFIDEIEDMYEKEQKIKKGRKTKKIKINLHEITDPVQWMRTVYCIVLQRLLLKGMQISKSDTSGEILKKYQERVKSKEPLDEITRTYENVRYNDHIPHQDEIERVMKSLEGINKI